MNLTKILAGLLLVLALALGLGALMLGRQTANRPVAPVTETSGTSASQPAPTHAVVVAAKPIAAGQRLVADDASGGSVQFLDDRCTAGPHHHDGSGARCTTV